MVWIRKKVSEIESIEKPKLDIGFSKRSTNAKTFRGFLSGCLQKARNDENSEMSIFIEELIKKFNEFYPQEIVKNEIKIISGWKGEGSIDIYKGFEDDFIIREFIKDKGTGAVSSVLHHVFKADVNRLLFWIKDWKLNESHICYDFAPKLGYDNWEDLWKVRKKYFSLYYYPIKVLEALGIIDYTGRGTITRIK